MDHIGKLNRRLGDALGYVRGGTLPRFRWMFAPDIPCWASRLDRVWVLAQWQRPSMSPAEWLRAFGDRYPYPANGMYHPHTEVALPRGCLPTEALTQKCIWAIDRQMSISLVQQLCDARNETEEDKERDYVEWVEKVQDSNPAFSNFEPGSRGGHVSYGGL